ncbi:hypothetical protein P152DRAFT_436660 [Eremomyces bilateralis CBS 781.70]|uniref:LCCL domain-containing protein n=1 Tax=Eremomyces bilateralis CBS 781.70 TaxID=1392243 RepID=A0A6G1G395_9PEZI|nr:uncharacterized protein P152DRAFT_436660 [Eremomyces bilateralis CBS 781.70]KAF1812401.1 hypothetical protein P152DRAFT_436660 [Eremomyces bilateralis CBS 781.70]
MAAPESINIKDITGKWSLNKTISDDIDPVLALQGIGWLTRKAIGLAGLTLHVKHYKDDDATEHIDIEQIASGGIKGTTELRTLNGEWHDHKDHIFGFVKGTSTWVQLSELDDNDEDEAFLKDGWDKGTQEIGLVKNHVESQGNGWVGRQTWGFADIDIDGKIERRHTRRVVVTKGSEAKRIRMVYDFISQ